MGKKMILGVTGCPTGIAHTFMAEKALKNSAKELGCDIKVETNGAIGVENKLTAKDIEMADAIIVACDKNVDMDRFNGKPVIEVPVKEGIHKANELIQRCIDGKVPIRKGSSSSSKVAEEGNLSFGQKLYKDLMNGVSHMLPLVVAGGVLTAISFLWGIYSFDPNSEQYNQIAATLKSVGGYSMNLMVPVLAAFIAQSISGRPGMLAGLVGGMISFDTGSGFLGGIIAGFLAGYLVKLFVHVLRKLPRQLEGLKSIFIIPIVSVGIVGVAMLLLGGPCSALNNAMMNFLSGLQNSSPIILGIVIGCMSAFDMGGPVNKAAYVTGTMLLGQGNYLFMAGVSAACITPPLVIAIASTLFKNRFTEEDRAAGLINYILGSTHITEGAIPFAAKNPLKVLPVLMIGSSISAILTYIMKIEVPAPHGGFLVLGLVNKPLLWVGCILVGSLIGAVLYMMVTPKVVDNKATTENTTKIKNEDEHKSTDKITTLENVSNDMSLYSEETVVLDIKGKNKADVIDEMVEILEKSGVLSDKNKFKEEIYKREEISSTGFGMGIAIPHAKTDAVKIPRVAVGVSKEGFDFESEDGNLVHIIFMIAATDNGDNLHLKTLSQLSSKLMNEEFLNELLNSKTSREIVSKLNNEEIKSI
ncbi:MULTISPECIES: PTS fructose transporter subunit IIABC [unclassified Clostridioides]|uniref:PTS fructose transporter subunit IIABC n=1 Tax=unclassified Clostridioides TaxID=2635829 RepID=UPI001D11D2FB|nr:PTS sugar transporter subunit IIA [Clostridioides sp. ES-S-0171-01]MCC0688839.1 PTS sugar transporter subunit IIA [Clostridioides sp. ES-S-0056-01]MCC0715004.1 PTS sugar transporter subunit IIA [Clostridioides sp. ES-S-0077-01]UDN54143.1 PTS fructose transporter subunit IIABC [Clostridioides sp. ES-S-0054-01]